MLKIVKKIISMILSFVILTFGIAPAAFAADGGLEDSKSSNITTTTTNEKYGNWQFKVTTMTDDSVSPSKVTKTAKITQYSGTTDKTVVVPGILDGATVTEIASQAFARHGEILALYIPSEVTKIDSWAFYDCNSVAVVSIANADVNLDTQAFQSNPNVVVYLNSGYSEQNANMLGTALGSNDKVSRTGYTGVTVDITDSDDTDSYTAIDKTLYAPYGTYLSVDSYPIAKDNINVVARGTGCTVSSESSDTNTYKYTISGSLTGIVDYTNNPTIADKLKDNITVNELNKTFRVLTAEQATSLNDKIAADSSYSAVKSRFKFEEGYYINGYKVKLDSKNVTAYDVKTGELIYSLVDGTVTNGKLVNANGYENLDYKYIGYKDIDNDGDVDIIYYSPYELSADVDTASISDSDEYLNGLSSQKEMDPVYYSFANSVITADGQDLEYDEPLDLRSTDTSFEYKGKDGKVQTYNGDSILGKANENRSILWATNYGTVSAKQINATSTSVGNWANMSYEAGLPSYNVEIVMQWGMNAALYATQGGTVKLGSKGNTSERSTISATGDGANGVISACGGKNVGSSSAKSSTSKVYVYNTDFKLEGWNNHVADCVYGGYAYLENVTASTGKKGSYSVGQGSSLANDFGNGVVEVNNYTADVYGNRSAGAYVIGSGVITGNNSSFTSYVDAGAVIASGGTYHLTNSKIKGVMGIKNRGGATGTSDVSDSTITAFRDYSDYVTGNKAKNAMEAWKTASGSYALMQYMMSDSTMTIGKLCENYNITGDAKTTLISTLSSIADTTYTDETLLRNSVLDNTYYNYSAASYAGKTDFYNVPYLTVGSSFGGNTNSILDFEASGTTLNLTNNKYVNENGDDYNYLISSEAGSSPTVNFINSNGTVTGIIWNEGDVSRAVEGRPGERTSSVVANFKNTDFNGSFADGSNGLWEGTSEYTNNAGTTTKLNGNYYGAKANWGVTASFDKDSSWKVAHDSYVGKLTIEDLSKVSADEPVTVYYNALGDGTDSRITDGAVYNNVTFVKVEK